MVVSTEEIPQGIRPLVRRFKRGYTVERTGGGHFRVRDPQGELVKHKGRNLTLTGDPGDVAMVRMRNALDEQGVLKPKETRARRRSRAESERLKRGIDVMRERQREAVIRRRDQARALRDEMQPWLKVIGAPTPGTLWDLAAYLHESSDGTFRSREAAHQAIRSVLDGAGVRDESREAIKRMSDRFLAEIDPLLFYVEIARKIRGIETIAAVELAPGQEWPYTIRLVEIDACFADGRYQRPSSQPFVREIVLTFDERMVGSIEVSDRTDGSYAILDGQTRWEACQLVGKKRIWAAIYEGMDLAAEARFFYWVNKRRKSVHPYYGFRARVLSGEEKAITINRLVEEHGLTVTTHAAERGIAAVGTLEWVFDLQSPVREDTLSPVLDVVGRKWNGLKRATDSELMRGLGRFYATYGDDEIVTRHWADQLQAFTPLLMLGRTRDIAGNVTASGGKRASGLSAAKALVGVHNTGLPRDQRLDIGRLERVG